VTIPDSPEPVALKKGDFVSFPKGTPQTWNMVATVADEVLVLDNGLICERGTTNQVLGNPQHLYTQRLLEAASSIVEVMDRWGAA